MHNLENLLLRLSAKLREAADLAEQLASASHNYEPTLLPGDPVSADDALAELNAKWSKP